PSRARLRFASVLLLATAGGRRLAEEQRGCHARTRWTVLGATTCGTRRPAGRRTCAGAQDPRRPLALAIVCAPLLRFLVVLEPGPVDCLGLALVLLGLEPLAALVVRDRAFLRNLLAVAVEAALRGDAGLLGLLLHRDGRGGEGDASERYGEREHRGDRFA